MRRHAVNFTLLTISVFFALSPSITRADRDADRDNEDERAGDVDGVGGSLRLEVEGRDEADAGALMKRLVAQRGYPYGQEVAEGLRDVRAASDELESTVQEQAAAAFDISKERNREYHTAVGNLSASLQRLQETTEISDAVQSDSITAYNSLALGLQAINGKIGTLLPPGSEGYTTWSPAMPMNLTSELDIRNKICPQNTRVHKASGSSCALRQDYGCDWFGLATFCHDGYPTTGCCCEADVMEHNTYSDMFSKRQIANGCGISLALQHDMLQQQAGLAPVGSITPFDEHYFCTDNSIVHKITSSKCKGLSPAAEPGCNGRFGGDIADFCAEGGKRGPNVACCCSAETIKGSTSGIFFKTKRARGCWNMQALMSLQKKQQTAKAMAAMAKDALPGPPPTMQELQSGLNLCKDGRVYDAENDNTKCRISEQQKRTCGPYELHTYCVGDYLGFCCCDPAMVSSGMFFGRSAKKCHESPKALAAYKEVQLALAMKQQNAKNLWGKAVAAVLTPKKEVNGVATTSEG